MNTKSRFLSVFIVMILAIALFAPASVFAAGTTTVKQSNVGVDWFTAAPFADTRTGGSVSFVMGPATPPLGLGSLQMTTTDAYGGSSAKAQAVTGSYIGTPLSSITSLSYYAYRDATSTNSPAQTISLNIAVDFVGDGSSFTTLVFEPVYQTGGVGAMQLNTWQLWDAYAGGSAKWWSTKPIPGVCDFNCFVTWDTIIANNQNAKIKGIFGFNIGSGWVGQFKGAVDSLVIEVDGDNTTYDFEPEPPCTTVCYVDAVNGNDSNGGASIGNAKKTIQAAIDAVNAGGQVRVLPGNYNETATNRQVLGTGGTYQFGLFIDKEGITIQGVDANNVAITEYDAPNAAYITTNATNNFGASGIFVQADDVTLAGLHIGPNIPGDNKTIEIIGDGFTLKDSHVDVPSGGSVYFNDWQFDTVNNVSHVQSYTLDHNLIDQSTSVDITSGAGYSGPAVGRQITNNVFENSEYWPSISFNGSGTGVPWFVQSVGGAVIQGNTFTNSFSGNDERAAHIRVRGTVDDSQFDWSSYWMDNTFNKAVVTLTNVTTFDVRQYTYVSGAYSFNTRRIGVNIQSGIDKAVAGDTVLVGSGLYTESPNIDKSLILKSSAGRDVTTIQLQSGPTYLGALTIGGTEVTVHGFTIAGFDGTPSMLASSNIYVTNTPTKVIVSDNRIKVGAIDTGSSNGDDGFGLLTTYNLSADVDQLNVNNNIFEPLNTSGTRAFYVNPGVDEFMFYSNQILGKFTRTAITQAKHGFVDENDLTGVGSLGNRSAGFGTWGYPTPTVYGHTYFRNNTITNVSKGVAIFTAENVTVLNNFFIDNDTAVWVGDSSSLSFNPATVVVNENSIVNSGLFGVQEASALTGTVNAQVNWWGSNLAADVAAEVDGDVDYTPWLCSGTDTSIDPGFQPSLQTNCSVFSGFFQPIDMNTTNLAKAGQTIPVKWRLVDAGGAPVSDPSMFAGLLSYNVSCTATPGLPDAIETYSGSSGLQYLGDGYWQFNWKTPKNYANTCRVIYVQFQGGLTSPEVDFKFKP